MEQKDDSVLPKAVTTIIAPLVIAFLAGCIVMAGGHDLWELVVHNKPLQRNSQAAIALVLLAVVCGILLYMVRVKRRMAYGIIEILVALVMAARLVFSDILQTEPTAALLSFLSAAFLIVCGMENISQA